MNLNAAVGVGQIAFETALGGAVVLRPTQHEYLLVAVRAAIEAAAPMIARDAGVTALLRAGEAHAQNMAAQLFPDRASQGLSIMQNGDHPV